MYNTVFICSRTAWKPKKIAIAAARAGSLNNKAKGLRGTDFMNPIDHVSRPKDSQTGDVQLYKRILINEPEKTVYL